MNGLNLSERMKTYYEYPYRIKPPKRMPVIIRLDGKAFHTFTKRFERPFDNNFINMMNETAKYLCKNVQGCQIAYVQSDEISLLLHNYKKLNSESWFDNNIQKMASVSAGMASSKFTIEYYKLLLGLFDFYKNENINKSFEEIIEQIYKNIEPIIFDSRIFILPENEVNNYFVWRQQDATRNSIQMIGQSKFSKSQLYKKSCNMIQEMLFQEHKINWNDYPTYLKRGRCIYKNDETNKWEVNNETPIFSHNSTYINRLLKTEEE